ncbi:PKD domain-containing protein [Truepera radiovictrix]|nr:PKD domain-containing protein [Truepera radiovictrix]WMT57789.1 PKD domain-containing protein [Truepera radiovictrix]
MSQARNVTAKFDAASPTPMTYTLTVNKPQNGTVTSTPQGINCGVNGNDCTEDYTSGTKVTLSANPATGYKFDSWGGACSGSTCEVTMNAATTVSATFSAVPQELNAEAGPARRSATVGETVQLDGSASTGATTYLWTMEKPTGSNATISGVTRVRASFVPDVPGQYKVTLTVGNGTDTDTDEQVVDVTLPAPVADAGDDREVKVNQSTPLDATDSKNAASFKWEVTTKAPGSSPQIAEPTKASTTFTADVVGEYVVTLTVFDSEGKQSDKDTVKITVIP